MESTKRDNDHEVGRRVRELYRYFQPERPSLASVSRTLSADDCLAPTAADYFGPTPSSPALLPQASSGSSVHGPPSTALVPEALVLGDPNTTLTSFAQLAALRLGVERVMISVSDRQSQFILAQATQSLSGPCDYESTGDGVWAGCSTLSSNTWPMCKSTVALPPSNRESGQYSFMVINDLSEHERYRRIPFVQGDPHFRFYAGTPLTTETNINIGCFFVLDTKPHAQGLSDGEKDILGSLGTLIMDYLKVSRQASEGRRAARLSRGLSCFVEGSSSFIDACHPSYTGSYASVPISSVSPNNINAANHLSVGSFNSFEMPSKRSFESDARSFSSVSEYRADQGTSSVPDTPLPDWWSDSRQKGLEESHGPSHSWAFRRAANLLRESLELDSEGGVMFLEAGNSPMLDVDSGSDCSGETSNPAPVLAISTNEEPFAPGPGSTVLYPATNLDNGFLHQLLRRYSKGKLWSFHRDGMLSSSDDDEKPRRNRSPRHTKSEIGAKGSGKKWKSMENSMLNLYFPNASQVIFVPLWNAANSQWFAGCFCWNTVETRVFNPSVELSSVLGFGSSIMAECSRVESLISDRQKGDFIGSISHELRSPLHGILAAAEFLSGTHLDEFQGSLLETINACGRTLLDTMNQVLDYSKIVSLERSWRHLKRSKTAEIKSADKFSAHLDTYMATDVALLAEEVVEGVCLGHAYGQKSTAAYDKPVLVGDVDASTSPVKPRPEVEVVMDIAQNDWIYQSQPGALRRIVMNVFGNAMKYTDSGRVTLHLDVAEPSDGRSRRHGAEDLVTLTVSDTGKGISEEFLRGRLYTPFAQEDTLAVGTGLGLSIVRSLVKSLQGSINIHSRPGEGTIVKVTLPLSRRDDASVEEAVDPRASLSPREKNEASESVSLCNKHAGRRVAILDVEPAAAAQHSVWSIITRYLTEWYGLELVSWSSRTAPVDIVLADELGLSSQLRKTLSSSVPALLVLCDNTADHSTTQSAYSHLARMVHLVRQPWGPHKMARAIRHCLDRQSDSTPTTVSLPERPRATSLLEKPLPPPPVSESDDATDLTPDASGSSVGSSVGSRNSPVLEISDTMSTIISPPSPLQALPTVTKTGLEIKTGEVSAIAKTEVQVKEVKTTDVKTTDVKIESTDGATRFPRVLVVDDNSINLNLMLTFMKKRNLATLDSAENGQLAVDAVERFQQGYDIIFMDMSMPVMNGFEATRAIRALEKERDSSGPAIIIALTGLSSSRDEADALASGVDLFLTKPVSFKEMARLLGEWEVDRLKGSVGEKLKGVAGMNTGSDVRVLS